MRAETQFRARSSLKAEYFAQAIRKRQPTAAICTKATEHSRIPAIEEMPPWQAKRSFQVLVTKA